MKLTKHKEVTTIEKITIGFKCDNCSKIHNGDSIPDDWHEFSGSHNSWGNDSFESYEYYMVCSPKCYTKLLQKAVKEFERYSDAEIDGFKVGFAKRMVAFLNTL
jgi:hypothetical protein